MLALNKIIMDSKTKRFKDSNGFLIVKENPIAKAGVFEYRMNEVDSNSNSNSNSIVKVCRPFEELEKKKDLFIGAPIIFNHEWVGLNKNEVDGAVIGEIKADYPYLKADLIFYNPELIETIEKGDAVEISPAYFCGGVKVNGMYEGLSYDYIQKINSVNHIAIVKEGRAGNDLRVYDSNETNGRKNNMKQKTIIKKLKNIISMVKDEKIKEDGPFNDLEMLKENLKKEYEKLELITTKEELEKWLLSLKSFFQDSGDFNDRKIEVEDEGEEEKKHEKVEDSIDALERLKSVLQNEGSGTQERIQEALKLLEELENEEKESEEKLDAESILEVIEKITDSKIKRVMDSKEKENKAIYDAYRDVSNVVGAFDFKNKNVNDIYGFGYECLANEKIQDGLDAKTAFFMKTKTSKTNMVTDSKSNIETITTKLNQLYK